MKIFLILHRGVTPENFRRKRIRYILFSFFFSISSFSFLLSRHPTPKGADECLQGLSPAGDEDFLNSNGQVVKT